MYDSKIQERRKIGNQIDEYQIDRKRIDIGIRIFSIFLFFVDEDTGCINSYSDKKSDDVWEKSKVNPNQLVYKTDLIASHLMFVTYLIQPLADKWARIFGLNTR